MFEIPGQSGHALPDVQRPVCATGHFYSQSRPFESNEQAPMHNAPTIANCIRYSKGKTLPIKARITQIAIAAPTTAIKGALKTTGIKCAPLTPNIGPRIRKMKTLSTCFDFRLETTAVRLVDGI
jgi:hypothetical protein